MEKEYGRIGFYEFYRIFSTVTFVRDDFVQKNRRVLAYNFDSKYELSDREKVSIELLLRAPNC